VSLVVEVTRVEGTLAINIPPPPSDRVWYVRGMGIIHFIVLLDTSITRHDIIDVE
jgi:hypothetical protein